MRLPRVSIVTPTYNRAHLSGETIDSVLAQSFGDSELLVMDDGSTDGTGELVLATTITASSTGRWSTPGICRSYATTVSDGPGGSTSPPRSDDLWRAETTPASSRATPTGMRRSAWCYAALKFRLPENRSSETSTRAQEPGHAEHSVRVGFHPLIEEKLMLYPSTVLFKKSLAETTGLLNQDIRDSEHESLFPPSFACPGSDPASAAREDP